MSALVSFTFVLFQLRSSLVLADTLEGHLIATDGEAVWIQDDSTAQLGWRRRIPAKVPFDGAVLVGRGPIGAVPGQAQQQLLPCERVNTEISASLHEELQPPCA